MKLTPAKLGELIQDEHKAHNDYMEMIDIDPYFEQLAKDEAKHERFLLRLQSKYGSKKEKKTYDPNLPISWKNMPPAHRKIANRIRRSHRDPNNVSSDILCEICGYEIQHDDACPESLKSIDTETLGNAYISMFIESSVKSISKAKKLLKDELFMDDTDIKIIADHFL